ncbi:MAG: hypothetical protein U1E23_06375 [Reyranellaceae bacterium]
MKTWAWLWTAIASALLLLGAGCTQAVPEFVLYVQAFDAQYEQGNAVLDIVGNAERTVALRKVKIDTTFNPNGAAYFLDGIDPPITASLRTSLRTLKSYNDALGGLASGEAADTLAVRLGAVTTNGAAGLSALAAAAGPAAALEAGAFVAGAKAALDTAMPLLKAAATAANREEFRRQLVLAHDPMRDLLQAMRAATPAMYELMIRSQVQRGNLDSASGIPPEGESRLSKQRELLAAWVVLMDKTLVALDHAAAAASARGGALPVAEMTDISIQLKVTAEQIKAIRAKQ